MDFKELLQDNILLLQKLQDLGQSSLFGAAAHPLPAGSKLRDVPDPLTWVSCFLAFLAAKADQESRELAAYGMIVLQLARKHGGTGWLLYDRQFRQQRAAGATLPWTEINSSLMAATVLGNANGLQPRSCPHCLLSDHSREECALAPLEDPKATATPPVGGRPSPTLRQPRRPAPYKLPDNSYCRRFNRGNCESSNCRYEHTCAACHKPGHAEIHCWDGEKGKGRAGDPYRPPPKGTPPQSGKN